LNLAVAAAGGGILVRLLAVLVAAGQLFELHGDVFERVVGVLERVLQLLEHAVPAGRERGDHDVIGGDDLGERAVASHDVLDQLHRLAEQRLAVVVGQLVPGLRPLLLVLDVTEVKLLIPQP
jgi:uncharacterized protein YcaQ